MWNEYISAVSINEVLQILTKKGSQARIVAGATDLILELERGARSGIETMIDITRIAANPQPCHGGRQLDHRFASQRHDHTAYGVGCLGYAQICEWRTQGETTGFLHWSS